MLLHRIVKSFCKSSQKWNLFVLKIYTNQSGPKHRLSFVLLIFISTQSFGQLLSQQSVQLSKSYSEISPLSQYLYDRSPTAWANEIKSPVLILHSRQDGFVPVSQALSMAQALQVTGVPYQLKVYEKKSHALPSWAFDSTAEIIDWFKNYMKK